MRVENLLYKLEITRNCANLPEYFEGLVDMVKLPGTHFVDFKRKRGLVRVS